MQMILNWVFGFLSFQIPVFYKCFRLRFIQMVVGIVFGRGLYNGNCFDRDVILFNLCR